MKYSSLNEESERFFFMSKKKTFLHEFILLDITAVNTKIQYKIANSFASIIGRNKAIVKIKNRTG